MRTRTVAPILSVRIFSGLGRLPPRSLPARYGCTSQSFAAGALAQGRKSLAHFVAGQGARAGVPSRALPARYGGAFGSTVRFGVLLFGLSLACTPQGDPGIGEGFVEDFERERLGPNWNRTGGNWRLEDGQLKVQGARNHPLWLRRVLPRDVRIEFDAKSDSPEGDIKVEVFGDGVSAADGDAYHATSYVVIFGGWGNSQNVLARMDEHGSDRVVGPRRSVETGRTYHFRIERRNRTLTVWIDGEVLLEMEDSEPLDGRGHEYFAFNNWQSDLSFDNLRVTPL